MKDKIRTTLGSERGMGIVNVLFVLSMLIHNSGITVAACAVWLIYLECFRRRTSSKVVKAANVIFMMFAACMLGINVYVIIGCIWKN